MMYKHHIIWHIYMYVNKNPISFIYDLYILFLFFYKRKSPTMWHQMTMTNLPSSHQMKITNLSFSHQMKMTNLPSSHWMKINNLSFSHQIKMTNFPSFCQMKMTNFPFFPSENDQSTFSLPVRCKRPSFPSDENDQLSLFLSDVNDPTFQIK